MTKTAPATGRTALTPGNGVLRSYATTAATIKSIPASDAISLISGAPPIGAIASKAPANSSHARVGSIKKAALGEFIVISKQRRKDAAPIIASTATFNFLLSQALTRRPTHVRIIIIAGTII